MGNLTLNGSTSGQITLAPTAVAGTNTLTLPASTGTLVTSESATISGNLTFTGTGNRITGDMSNATFSSRLAFQSSTTNGNTNVTTLPNGTATSSGIQCYNAADPTNAAFANIGAGSTEIQFLSAVRGTGTYLPMTFYTSGSERMRIDTSGNVGIGTSNTPSNKDTVTPKFVVNGSGVAGSMQIVRNTTVGAGGAVLELTATRGTDVNSYTILQNGDGVGSVIFGGADGNEFVVAGSIQCQVDGTPGDNDMPGRLIFNTTADGASVATERMRIDSSGNVGVGTSSPAGKLEVSAANSIVYSTGTAGFGSFYAKGSGTNSSYLFLGNANGEQGRITAENGGPITFSNTSSPTERMRIDSIGNLLVGASSQIGSEKFGVTSGTTNATQYTTIATKGGSSFYIEQQQTTSVSTTATAILASPKYCTFCLVHGSDGTNRFSDVVLMSVGTGTVNVISSLSASGTPSARTYSQSSSTLRVAMGSGTYTVQATSLNMTS